MQVKAIRRFWSSGRLIEPDEVTEVDESLAREIIASGKAVVAVDPAPETNSETTAQDPTDQG